MAPVIDFFVCFCRLEKDRHGFFTFDGAMVPFPTLSLKAADIFLESLVELEIVMKEEADALRRKVVNAGLPEQMSFEEAMRWVGTVSPASALALRFLQNPAVN